MKKLYLIFALIAFGVYGNCNAAVDNALVSSAEKYLNSITGLSGEFIQYASGKRQQGNFAMLRPGRVRLDYKDMPVQLISDGKDLYFFDRSLDQITTVPLTSTPAGILVRKNIDLKNADINVVETASDNNTFSLMMNLRGQEGLGNMMVVFDKKPVKLNSWTVIDAMGAQTDVKFVNLQPRTSFDKNYFQIGRHKTVSTSGGDSFYE